MKNLLLLLVILMLSSCREYNPDKKSVITIINIENSKNPNIYGKYKYTLSTTNSSLKITYLFSDVKYQLNDTLIMIKK